MPTIAWSGSFVNLGFHGRLFENLHNIPTVTEQSHIYVSICEIASDGTRFVGNAVMTIHGVAPLPPRPGDDFWGIVVRLDIDWDEDLAFRLDVIVVNEDDG
jgi:hypothetical protein